ncbi:MAG: serine protease Do [Planctomycetota bacterium]
MSGFACLAVGVAFGASCQRPIEQLWREPAGPTVQVVTQLPTFRDLVHRVEAAVVSVRAVMPVSEPTEPTEGTAVATGAGAGANGEAPARIVTQNGSGFIINERGLVLTSRHVVAGAESIHVILPNHLPRRADLIGQDAATDLALLRLTSAPQNLPALSLGDSDQVLAGDWIVAVGNPYGFTRTVTAGLVSFVGRHLPDSDLGVSSDFMQISAQVNPGSSGCPVFDVNGHVVGVTTQQATSARGISFAVPSRSVKWALAKMRKHPDGIVRRGYLGIHFAARRDTSATGEALPGAVIVGVTAGDPADLAGLRSGDVVLAVDGSPILDLKDLHERIVCSDPGTSIALRLLRDDQLCDPIVAVLGEIGKRASTPETP